MLYKVLWGLCMGPSAFCPTVSLPWEGRRGSREMERRCRGNSSSQKGPLCHRWNQTSELPDGSEPSMPCQSSAQESVPAGRGAAPSAAQTEPAAESVSRHCSRGPAVPTPTHRLPARSNPLACTARAFVEQITSKCLALRHRERGKPRFVPGSAHSTKKAAAPLKNTTACKLSN